MVPFGFPATPSQKGIAEKHPVDERTGKGLKNPRQERLGVR